MADPPPPPAAGGGDHNDDASKSSSKKQDKSKAKKRTVAVQPVPPPSVCTTLLILRGVVAGVLGCPIGSTPEEGEGGDDTTPSLMQPSYLKDGYPSGKFSVPLGKKTGTGCAVQLPSSDDGAADDNAVDGAASNAVTTTAVLDAIENAANRIRESNLDVITFQMDREEAIAKYGECILDAEQKNKKKDKKKKKKKGKDDENNEEESKADASANVITLAYLPGIILAVPPGPVYANTGAIPGRIVLERDGNGKTSISAGKKARKAEIVIKFRIDVDGDGGGGGGGGGDAMDVDASSGGGGGASIDPADIAPLLTREVRMEEGRDLLAIQAVSAVSLEDKSSASAAGTGTGTDAEAGADANNNNGDMVVNAFEVSGKIDYTRLVQDFGSRIIDPDLLARIERLTVGRGTVPCLHRFLRRDIFFSHRDLTKICDCLEQGKPFYLYTGRGPSSGAMHLGHLVPFLFTQWLQRAFQCPLVIQMTDDEKFLFKGTYTDEDGDNLDHFAQLTMENARDIIACGFDPTKTFLFSDLDYVGTMYPNIVRIWKAVTTNTVNGIFGFDGTSNIGKVAFPAVQAAPSFPSSFPVVLNAKRDSEMACLIPCAIDQDPYFRMTRDVARKLVPKSHPLEGKPALIHSKFFPPLQGAEGKMSSSDPNSAVFLTDTPDEIERKIREYAFSGGRETKKLQQELGADLDVDVPYQWLRFFFEDDDELARIGREYGTGSGEYWSTGAVKAKLVQVLQEIVEQHQKRRKDISDDVVREWMEERCIV